MTRLLIPSPSPPPSLSTGDDFSGRPQLAGGAGSSLASGKRGEGGTTITTTADPRMHSKSAKKILKAQKQPPGPTLFLGNLGFETTEADILEMLTAHRNAPVVSAAGKDLTSRDGSNGDKDKGKTGDSGAEAKAKDKTKEAPTGTRSWVRKVRMGTFEDSGLCKGYVRTLLSTIRSHC